VRSRGALPLSKAKTLSKLGKHDACARALEDYLASQPLDEDANLLLGVSLEEAGHFRSARAVYEFTAEIAPRNPEALKRAGSMMQRTGDHARALEYYERALEADPRDQEALKARKNLAAETALSRSSAGTVTHSRELIKDKDRSRELERSKRMVLSEDELRAELAKLEERYAAAPSDPELMLHWPTSHERLGDPAAALGLRRARAQLSQRLLRARLQGRRPRVKRLKKAVARADKGGKQRTPVPLERELIAHEVKDYRRRVETRPSDRTPATSPWRRSFCAPTTWTEPWPSCSVARANRACATRRCSTWRSASSRRASSILAQQGVRAARWPERRQGRARQRRSCTTSAPSPRPRGTATSARSYYIRIYEIDIGYRDVAAKMGTLST
jgi:tetratricopeptide (TPR) repeat protein